VASFVLIQGAMRTRHLASALLLLLASCVEERARPPAPPPPPTEVELAEARWAETKVDCRTYHYTLAFDSFSGTKTRTSFEIVDDVATVRTYVRVDGASIYESWVETGAEIGSHFGELPRTMEQLYEDCARDVLSQSPGTNVIVFSSDQRGVLQSCLYVPSGCHDDCAMGDRVTGFGCGPLDTTPPRP
jgi:hypothetical protein